MSSFSAEALSEFVQECEELSQRVSSNLVLIEKGSQTEEVIQELYRDMHTIKGSALLYGFEQMGQIAHAMETCLDPIRRLNWNPTPELIDSIYSCLDVLKEILQWVQKEGKEPDFKLKLETVIPRLVEVATQDFTGTKNLARDLPGIEDNYDIDRTQNEIKPSTPPNTIPTNNSITTEPYPKPTLPPTPVVEQNSHLVIPPNSQKKEETIMQTAVAPAEKEKTTGSTEASATIRVHVNTLDKLMNLVGEMVLVRNQVLQYSESLDDMSLLQMSQRLDLVTSDLQSEVMKTRMQPIGGVVEPFQRIVRDLSRELNKKIQLVLLGKDTELDKTLLEAIKDPLTHIVRNSADHGIELPEERKEKGKPETGKIQVRSFHEGGQVIVEVSDDGKGLDREKILARIIDKGLAKPEHAHQMTDRQIYNFIFNAGFSTAATVTTVSGRGVGMDVVKTNIEKIGGSVEISSSLGQGTLIRLKIPLTLAIVPALLVKSADQRFAIPQVKLVELVRIEDENSQNKVEYLQGKPMYRLRGALLPLVDLREVLKLERPATDLEKTTSAVNIAVLNAEGDLFGLIVDEIQDTADIVVKPLSGFLKNLSVYSGATIMGDGSVAIILDVNGITEWVHLFNNKQNEENQSMDVGDNQKGVSTESQEFLLFNTAAAGKYTIPLCLVHRLEEVSASSVEFTGEQAVVRYRDSILPLISLNKFLNFKKPVLQTEVEYSETEKMLSIIVIQKKERNFGVLVDEILDVVTINQDIDNSVKDRPGILGNLVVNEEVCVVVDILKVIECEAQRIGQDTGQDDQRDRATKQLRQKHKILFAEDSSFFKRQVSAALKDAGYKVLVANDGQEALDAAQNGDFSALVSDIEMPRLNGFQLAAELRKLEKWTNTPLIALTTRFRERDIQKGKDAGFNKYLEKFNSEELIEGLDLLVLSNGGN